MSLYSVGTITVSRSEPGDPPINEPERYPALHTQCPDVPSDRIMDELRKSLELANGGFCDGCQKLRYGPIILGLCPECVEAWQKGGSA